VNNEAPERARILSEAIAAEMRAEKSAQKLGYEEIKDASEIPLRTLTRYFKGERSMNAEHFLLLCDALGVTPADIIARARARAGF
jgi:transcriptional regulator with XRE-family HTH domain